LNIARSFDLHFSSQCSHCKHITVLSDARNDAAHTPHHLQVVLQPTIYWKNAAQQGLPFTLKPSLLYRGIGAALV
jgi:hypothetical protein